MDRFDTLHHQITEQKLIIQMQEKQIDNIKDMEDSPSIDIIRSTMRLVQDNNWKKLRELRAELEGLE